MSGDGGSKATAQKRPMTVLQTSFIVYMTGATDPR
jgi:hypothetical protein